MKKYLIITFFLLIFSQAGFSQLDSIRNFCNSFIKYPYVSDGQEYRAFLTADQTAEFHVTFYGGVTYRIAIASTPEEGDVVFRLYDKFGNELFSSDKYNYPAYWDFNFESTVNCYIDAELAGKKQSGVVMMYIAFKQQN